MSKYQAKNVQVFQVVPDYNRQTREQFLREIEHAPQDNDLKRLFADWLEERGEGDLAFAFRWCAHYNRHPLRDHEAPRWGWASVMNVIDWRKSSFHLPRTVHGSMMYWIWFTSLEHAFHHVAVFWAEVRELGDIG